MCIEKSSIAVLALQNSSAENEAFGRFRTIVPGNRRHGRHGESPRSAPVVPGKVAGRVRGVQAR